MRKLLLVSVCSAILGCTSTNNQSHQDYADLPTIQNAMSSDKWLNLTRFPARYPVREVKANNEGCATVEYVITPDYQIEAIQVVSSTRKSFAMAAKNVVENWRWSELPQGILAAPIKTQTRFEFCLESGDDHCSETSLANSKQCPGEDVVASVGSIIKKVNLRRSTAL